ncbi:aminopeptidase P family N-terminal domain-containing protein [Acuticoccus sediminis]|uniref:aminopeptidase P family N-terminal domain-containing protein n=1 Tax=Acuticoccus sediminis TaxID=2184697 RepID=UPI0026BD930D
MTDLSDRPRNFTCHNGERVALPFSPDEYQRRMAALRRIMAEADVAAVVFTSMHNIAYYTGFLYCSFGRPFGCVVTPDAATTVTPNIDAGQPWRRSHCDNVIYTDWQRDNFWRTVAGLAGGAARIGVEGDHLTLAGRDALAAATGPAGLVDIASRTMAARLVKSAE